MFPINFINGSSKVADPESEKIESVEKLMIKMEKLLL